MSEQDHVYELNPNPNINFCKLWGKNINDTGKGLVSHNKKYHDNVICHICGFESQVIVWKEINFFCSDLIWI